MAYYSFPEEKYQDFEICEIKATGCLSSEVLVIAIGNIRTVAILAIDNRFPILSLKLKWLGMSLSGTKQEFSIPRESTWPPCDY